TPGSDLPSSRCKGERGLTQRRCPTATCFHTMLISEQRWQIASQVSQLLPGSLSRIRSLIVRRLQLEFPTARIDGPRRDTIAPRTNGPPKRRSHAPAGIYLSWLWLIAKRRKARKSWRRTNPS